MSWIITNRKDALIAGADLDQDRVMLAVTPNYVAQRYDDYTADADDSHTPLWENLPEEKRQTLIKAVDAYCDKELLNIDNAIASILNQELQTS